LLGGVGEALKWSRLEPIVQSYRGMIDIFILAVDRDGVENRASRLRSLEEQARSLLRDDKSFIAENAWQELEVWVLAGFKDLEWRWQDIREHRDPKEHYYKPFARQRGVLDQLYEGRRVLAEEAARNYKRIRRLCVEDVQALEQRIRESLTTAT
jgi:hypothetical protein